MKKFLSIRDLRERDGIAPSTRWQWIKYGLYPKPIKFGPRQARWPIEAIEAYEQTRIAESKVDAA